MTGLRGSHAGSFEVGHALRDGAYDIERYSEFVDGGILAGLRRAVFFDRETFGEDRLVVGSGDLPWEDFFAHAPFSDQARADLIRIHTQARDYMSGLSAPEKRARLAKMSYQDYLIKIAKVSQEAIKFFLGQGGSWWPHTSDRGSCTIWRPTGLKLTTWPATALTSCRT